MTIRSNCLSFYNLKYPNEVDEISKDYLSLILKNIAREILYAKTGREAVEHCSKNKDIDFSIDGH